MALARELRTFLEQSPSREFTAQALSEAVGQHIRVTQMVLGKLVSSGTVHKNESGTYQAVSVA